MKSSTLSWEDKKSSEQIKNKKSRRQTARIYNQTNTCVYLTMCVVIVKVHYDTAIISTNHKLFSRQRWQIICSATVHPFTSNTSTHFPMQRQQSYSMYRWRNGTHLHATTCNVVHHPDAVIPCIVVAVIGTRSSMTHTQFSKNNKVPEIRVWYNADIWYTTQETWLCFIAVMGSIKRIRTGIF